MARNTNNKQRAIASCYSSCLVLSIALAVLLPMSAVADECNQEPEAPDVKVLEGTQVSAFQATGVIDASPQLCWKVIRDYNAYKRTMPYIESTYVVDRETDKVLYIYSRLDPGRGVSMRDYTIKILDESDLQKSIFKSSWTLANAKGPLPTYGVVRIEVNHGYWEFAPLCNGSRTRATYFIQTDPGGWLSYLPFAAEWGTRIAIPKTFQAIREAVKKPEYKE